MATGGAWQSETFDAGQKTWPAEAPPPMQQPTAAPPPQIYNPPARGNRESASIGIIMLALRVLQFLFSLVALVVVASNKYDDFAEYHAYTGLVVMNAIVCLYVVVQVVLSVAIRSTVGSFASFPTTSTGIFTFVFDTILAYAVMGVSGGATEIIAPRRGRRACVSSSKSCQQDAWGISMSFFAWAALAAAATLYPFRLLWLLKR